MRLSVFNAGSQKQALQQLALLTQKSTVHPKIREAALALTNRPGPVNGWGDPGITSGCADRDDMCEIEAVFNAVKYGDPRVKALKKGMRYVADPRWADFFTAPHRTLSLCEGGSCGGDCDDQAALVAALLGSLGFQVGLRVWGESADNFVHVYPVVGVPKRDPQGAPLGLDTTVERSEVGWEPPGGVTMTAWLE